MLAQQTVLLFAAFPLFVCYKSLCVLFAFLFPVLSVPSKSFLVLLSSLSCSLSLFLCCVRFYIISLLLFVSSLCPFFLPSAFLSSSFSCLPLCSCPSLGFSVLPSFSSRLLSSSSLFCSVLLSFHFFASHSFFSSFLSSSLLPVFFFLSLLLSSPLLSFPFGFIRKNSRKKREQVNE